MIPITGKVDGVGPTISALNQLPSLFRQAGIGGMTEVLTLFSKTVREKYLRGPYPMEIARRSGSFAATFVRGHRENIFTVRAEGTSVLGTYGSSDIRAQVLDEGTGYLPGGVITSKRAGGYLAIPTNAARTSPGGRLKHQYANRSWREVPNTFVGRSKKGGLYIARKIGRGRNARIEVLANLVKSVRIAGRHFMQKTLAVVHPQLSPIFQQRFDRIIQHVTATISRLRG